VTTTAVIVLGILLWIVMAIPVALVAARVIQHNRPPAPAIELPRAPAVATALMRASGSVIRRTRARPLAGEHCVALDSESC
jgi:hypothetical protein